jgi:LysM repeat protein
MTAAPTLTPDVTPTLSLDPIITPTPTPCTPNAEWEDTYIVQEGDTLGAIAIAGGISIKALQDGNCLENRDLLRVGEVLHVPNVIAINIAASPQGIAGAIVFIQQADDGSQDVWTVKSDGTERRQMTSEGTVVGRMARSMDTVRVAYRVISPFYRLPEDEPITTELPSNIWIMNADGTGQQLLIDQGPSETLVRSVPVWSPDGNRIAFSEQEDQRGALVVINTDRTERFVLTTGRFAPPDQTEPVAPAWSPDGGQLAYIMWAGVRPALQVIDLQTLAVQTLDMGFLYADGPYWVPRDGEFGPPAIGYGVREAGEIRWKVVDPETGLISNRRTGLVMVSPDLDWSFQAGSTSLHLFDANGIPQDQSLPLTFGAITWGRVDGQFVMQEEDGNLVLVDLINNARMPFIDTDGAQYPLWTAPLWWVLP